jgi:hypothetical protein
VPPTAISKAFYVEVDEVKELQTNRRVEKYGTAELAEAVHYLMWKAYEDTLDLINTAPPARRLQINMNLLSKAQTLVGNQTPDGVLRIQAELDAMMSETRRTDSDPTSSIYETGSANAPPDDPEKGSTGGTTRPE